MWSTSDSTMYVVHDISVCGNNLFFYLKRLFVSEYACLQLLMHLRTNERKIMRELSCFDATETLAKVVLPDFLSG